MAYSRLQPDQIVQFRQDGFLIVRDVIDAADLDGLIKACDRILEKKHKVAYDWAWDENRAREDRLFRIVQASPSRLNPGLLTANPFRQWMQETASSLMGFDMEFWYDQFLAKPPDISAPTAWHQDEGYWGQALDDKGVTCWMPFHDVDVNNGCMFFIPEGHKQGVLEHSQVAGVQSDLLHCQVDEARRVGCPLKLGDVTFHHGKMPHMTPVNNSDSWRRILTNHFKMVGIEGEGDHYPWKRYVNQYTGEVHVPAK
jgi:hypothetical protein